MRVWVVLVLLVFFSSGCIENQDGIITIDINKILKSDSSNEIESPTSIEEIEEVELPVETAIESDFLNLPYNEWKTELEAELLELQEQRSNYTSAQYEEKWREIQGKYGKSVRWNGVVSDVRKDYGNSDRLWVYIHITDMDGSMGFLMDKETALNLNKGDTLQLELSIKKLFCPSWNDCYYDLDVLSFEKI